MSNSVKPVITVTVGKNDFTLTPPVVFEIPLDNYADELCRKRNKKLYQKIKMLKKKSQELRDKLESYSEKHEFLLQRSKQLVVAGLLTDCKIIKRDPL